jgi:hypothetical protein
MYWGNVGHPNAHGGVDREIFDAGEGLAVLEGGEGRFGELEIGRRNEAGGAGDEFPLTDGAGHGSLRENSSGGEGEKANGIGGDLSTANREADEELRRGHRGSRVHREERRGIQWTERGWIGMGA